jgi:hypothetical protein
MEGFWRFGNLGEIYGYVKRVFMVSGDGIVLSPVLGGWVGVAAHGWRWAAVGEGGWEREDGD